MSKTTIDLPIAKDEQKRWLAQKLESYFIKVDEWQWPWVRQSQYESVCFIMEQFWRLEFTVVDGVEYWIGEPKPGSAIDQISLAAFYLSVASGLRVTFDCNGTTFIVFQKTKG